ncbi:hypothetical protein JCM8097_001312 [Rhodosporidiobolus ruineniae]
MGVDSDRFEEQAVPDWLTCPEHVLCFDCVSKLVSTASASHAPPACPTCRAPLQLKPSLVLKRALEGYKLVCAKKAEGCTWVGSLGDEKRHVEQDCIYRMVQCLRCAATFVAKDTDAHQLVCPLLPVVCARGGPNCGGIKGSGTFVRRDTAAHAARCAEYPCRYSCGTRTTARNLFAHESQCYQLRLRCDRLRQQFRGLAEKLLDATAEINQLKAARPTPASSTASSASPGSSSDAPSAAAASTSAPMTSASTRIATASTWSSTSAVPPAGLSPSASSSVQPKNSTPSPLTPIYLSDSSSSSSDEEASDEGDGGQEEELKCAALKRSLEALVGRSQVKRAKVG